jgi:hypothetical protein
VFALTGCDGGVQIGGGEGIESESTVVEAGCERGVLSVRYVL